MTFSLAIETLVSFKQLLPLVGCHSWAVASSCRGRRCVCGRRGRGKGRGCTGVGSALILSLVNCLEGLVNDTAVVCESFHGNFCVELDDDLTLEVEREFVVELIL